MAASQDLTAIGVGVMDKLIAAEQSGDIDACVSILGGLVGRRDQDILDTAYRFFGRYAGAVGAQSALVLLAADTYPLETFRAYLIDRVEVDPEFGPPFIQGLFELEVIGEKWLLDLLDNQIFAGLITRTMMQRQAYRRPRILTALRRAVASGRIQADWGEAIRELIEIIEGRLTSELPVPRHIAHTEKALIETRPIIRTSSSHSLAANDADMSPNGKLLVSCGVDRSVRLWDAKTGKQTGIWFDHGGIAHTCQFIDKGQKVLSAGRAGLILIDVRSGQLIRQVGSTTSTDVDSSLDQHLVVTADIDAHARAWNLKTGALVGAYKHGDSVECVSVHHSGELLATGSATGEIVVWEPFKGTRQTSFNGHDGSLRSLCFASKGKLLAAASDSSMTIWDYEKGDALATLHGHEGRLTTVMFHPEDPEIALSASIDGMARIWKWRQGITLEILADGTLTKARFSPCGRFVTTTGIDGSAAIWRSISFD